MRYYLAVLFVVVIFAVPWMAHNYPLQVSQGLDQLAAIIMHNTRTVAGLQSKYNTKVVRGNGKIRVLIVPGHEPDYGGAEYGLVKERNLVVPLADDLADFLRQSGKYEVFVTRDSETWDPVFADYFTKNWNAIIDWQRSYKQETSRLISLGELKRERSPVLHNAAPSNVAMRLFGMTKWANENDIDITIHVHLNDYPGHGSGPGKYTGFAIYAPSSQYNNSTTTHAIADTVFKRLAKYNPVSDMPQESSGIIDDPELIAVGANNTADSASMLIEYGYIYEQQFTDQTVRPTAIRELAYQTYLGLQDFFDPTNAIGLARSYDTLQLPHQWDTSVTNKDATSSDVYALQTALLVDGDYPPADKNLNDCPRTGRVGPCTRAAIDVFQKKHGITGEFGVAGPRTVEALNLQYGAI